MKGTMTWSDVKSAIRDTLLSRGLADPRIRLNALGSIDRLLDTRCPEVKACPELILNYPKVELIERLGTSKSNGRLNSAEKSVLNNVCQVVGGKGMASTSLVRQKKNGVSTRCEQRRCQRAERRKLRHRPMR